MGRGVKIPWIGESIYHGQGVQYTMGRGVDMPWLGGKIPWIEGRYIMGRGPIYHG